MAKQIKTGAALKWAVSITIAFVVVYILITQVYESSKYTFASKDALVREFRSISAPNNSHPISDMVFVDRKTFYYATERFSSEQSAEAVTRYYVDNLKSNGWNYLGTEKAGDYSSQFCKAGMLGSLGFIDSPGGETIYVLTLTTGGTAMKTCS